MHVSLRPALAADLDQILALEHRPDNREFIGQWPREEHLASMARPDRQHLVMTGTDAEFLGYLIAYDVSAAGFGVYIKRIAVTERSLGIGRAALEAFGRRPPASLSPFVCLAVRPHNERAQRSYRAVGFIEWALDAPALRAFLTHVDPAAEGCLVMRRSRH